MEAVVLAVPDAEAMLARLVEGIRAATKASRTGPAPSAV
jgi:hypothetical protein